MSRVFGLAIGIGLTLALLWLILTGASAWRHAVARPSAPPGPVPVRLIGRDAGF
jgi:hypothetical protein